MTVRRAVGVVALVAMLGTAGCGGGKPTAAPSPEPSPAGACITADEQRAGGVRVDMGGGKVLQGVVVGTGDTGIVFANQLPDTLCGWREWAGVDELRRRGVRKVFLVGASMGGTAVLGAAPRAQPPVAGVVSLSGRADFAGIDALAAARKLTAPVFFVAAKDDLPPGADAQRFYDACPSRDKKLDLEVGGTHGRSLLDDAMSAKVEAFLRNH